MTWVDAGMTESSTYCEPGAIHAAKVNGTVEQMGLALPKSVR